MTLTLTPFSIALASVRLNEINYDLKTGSDTGREWIEVYNGSSSSVDFSTLRLFESDTNHKLKLVQGDKNIPANGYAIIVSNFDKFKIDNPNFSGTVFDSSFSLSNDGETLALKDKDLNILDQYIYTSTLAAGNGKTLQKINGVWVEAVPTLSAENKIEEIKVETHTEVKKEEVKTEIKPEVKIENKKVSKKNIKNETEKIIENTEISQTASVIDIPPENSKSYLFQIILIPLLLSGTASVYFIRRKKAPQTPGDDFEVTEE